MYQVVLLLPNIAEPTVHAAPEFAIVFVVSLEEPGVDRPLAHIDEHLDMPPAAQFPEPGRAVGIYQCDVEDTVEQLAHRRHCDRKSAGSRVQQVAVRHIALVALCLAEARTFDEVDDRCRRMPELRARSARRL